MLDLPSILLGAFLSSIFSAFLAAIGRARGVIVFRRRAPRPKPAQIEKLKAELNAAFDGLFEMVGVRRLVPHLEFAGPLTLPSDVQVEAESIRKDLARNQMHAIIDSSASNLRSDPMHLVCRNCDYAAIRAMRNNGGKPKVVSAGAVVTCSERGQVLLHQRSRENVDTMKGRLHILGGAYMDKTAGMGNDAGDLSFTAAREMFEEAGVFNEPPAKWPALVSWETPTGFFQVIYLGLDVPDRQVQRHHGYPEGTVLPVDFADLEGLLIDGKWVDSGRAAILAWLALGAPSTGRSNFQGRKAKAMYKRVMKQLNFG